MTKPDLDHIRAGMRTHMIADESAAVMRLIETADLIAFGIWLSLCGAGAGCAGREG